LDRAKSKEISRNGDRRGGETPSAVGMAQSESGYLKNWGKMSLSVGARGGKTVRWEGNDHLTVNNVGSIGVEKRPHQRVKLVSVAGKRKRLEGSAKAGHGKKERKTEEKKRKKNVSTQVWKTKTQRIVKGKHHPLWVRKTLSTKRKEEKGKEALKRCKLRN